MASVHYLCVEGYKIPFRIREQFGINEIDLKKRTWAAVKIQKVWRGYMVRQMIARWNEAATTIQKYVRGWLVRWHLPEIYEEYLRRRAWIRYNQAALTIQKWWRGLMARRKYGNVKDILRRRRELIAINLKMQELLRQLFAKLHRKPGDLLTREEIEEIEEEAKRNVVFVLYKMHHLLRTTAIEGIYSIHNSCQLSYIEKLMKVLKFKDYMDEVKEAYETMAETKETETKPLHKNKKLAKMEELYRLRDTSRELKEVAHSIPLFEQEKPFNLNTKLPEEKYKRKLEFMDIYKPKCDILARSVDKTKNVSYTSFDLNVYKKAKLRGKPLPYYIDFWENFKCEEHNCSKIFH